MNVFDLFRGFFAVPGGRHHGQRDPFFDAMTHDEDEDDDEEDGFSCDEFRGEQQDPFDRALRFGFSIGPDGMRMQEPPVFGQVLRDMEEIFSQLGRWDGPPQSGHWDVPTIGPPPPPPQGRAERGGWGSGANPLRDFMLKSPYDNPQGPQAAPSREPGSDRHPSYESPDFPSSQFRGWSPFSKFNDIRKRGPQTSSEDERKEDRDLDSAVSSRGLDQILTPPAGQHPNQPRARSFFQSVVVTKVLKPDGSVEERRTVRDSKGNEETTVTRSGGSGAQEALDRHNAPAVSGDQNPFSDMRDDGSLFSKFFGGFR
ncbi:HCLS1-associated protein X-1 isoform X1 [Gasterosteus aculeatus]|uniref:HCLS1 associated protein X-1 n=1 Tax=Gasterosteus aculeatus aculeatus TaxID=481459 RepID=G3NKJ4_GASAC|nr:HCLS1-associated protein X-1 [Gasterosteus aculeatus aculeatus]